MSAAKGPLLRRISPEDLGREQRPPIDRAVLDQARSIVDDVRANGDAALREYSERFGERSVGDPLVLGVDAMRAAWATMDPGDRSVLERAAGRIRAFAQAQREAIGAVDVPIPGGRAGHTVEPIESAGCYAPAGRYPLPSSVLMTAVTARTAGCARVVVVSPGAHPVTLAAAHIAGADAFIPLGGAHAIAALAHGTESVDPCDIIVGPGNAWVTAAKQIVSAFVGIDMLAGPSELLVIADQSADPALIASDLLAQAEHDTDAVPMLVTTSGTLVDAVERELEHQLRALGTAETARAALRNGFACPAPGIDAAIDAADRIGAEHLEIMTIEPAAHARRLKNAGALFIGSASAEVLGDYGAGPNHTLPTGGTARFRAGLSVASFLRLRTWIRIDDADAAAPLVADASALARMEGLDAHRASALARRV